MVDPAAFRRAWEARATATLRLDRPIPVYVTYFTAEADAAGGLVAHGDPYGHDARLLRALNGEEAHAGAIDAADIG